MKSSNRRDFLKTAAAAGILGPFAAGKVSVTSPDSANPVVAAAIEHLQRALAARSLGDVAIDAAIRAGVPESFVVKPGAKLEVTGGDARGLSYALREIADRLEYGSDWKAAQAAVRETSQPANQVRAISRLFSSDLHDKPWFNDREMWPAYFDMLAAQRFNRFHLALGIGYDFLREVTDAYFLFAYPFLVAPSGYNVRASNLSNEERDSNLAMLKYISDQAALRGLDFHLGLWTHGYQWMNTGVARPPNHTITGLSAENHAAYCRDALTEVLRACPAITGLTIRIHGESGVAEGNYPFWATVFDGIKRSGRVVEIDLHSKGLDGPMLDTALQTGLPVTVSPKFWAEHMGLPYHQTDIRGEEIPRRERGGSGLMALSTGSRSFTRYGYADLLRRDRKYKVVHRIWPGTQRLLLWGDPVFAAAYSRAFQFCGSNGVDIMEPLSFKGRRGSGTGARTGYADKSLEPKWDWQKYLYTYRVWGRALYNPKSDVDGTRRYMRQHFGASAVDVETALGAASRVLPLVTTAYAPSAANNAYWPEMYVNQPIVDSGQKHPYSDTPAPKVFGNATGFDPRLFAAANERPGAKYSLLEVADWLDKLAKTAGDAITRVSMKPPKTVEWRRVAIDVSILAGLGRFFADKFRAGVYYHAKNGAALKAYQRARDTWIQLAPVGSVYADDITVGQQPCLRGHWSARFAAIDADISAIDADIAAMPAANLTGDAPPPPRRPVIACKHNPPGRAAGALAIEPLMIKIATSAKSVRLHYRHVTQAERFETVDMRAEGGVHRATIPAAYLESPYPIQYYFELEGAALYPGLGDDLTEQPYFIV